MDINRCIICNIDMGPENPRQLCRKTYCPDEFIQSIDETDVVNDEDKNIKGNVVKMDGTNIVKEDDTKLESIQLTKKRKLSN